MISAADFLKRKNNPEATPVAKANTGLVSAADFLKSKQTAVAPTPFIPGVSALPGFKAHVKEPSPMFKDNSFLGIAKNTITGLFNPENWPLGIGQVVKTIKNEPETVAKLTASDFLAGTIETAKGLAKLPFTAVSNLAGTPVEFNIPGLGKVTNRQFNTAQRIQNGEDMGVVLAEESSGAIFDTLFLYGMGVKVFGGRPTTIAKTDLPKDSGITVKQPPKSFRLYEEPVATASLSSDFVQKMAIEKGVKLQNYDPSLPSYFRMTGKSGGNIVGEVVQIKPSYAQTFLNVLKGDTAKVPSSQTTVLISNQVRPTALSETKAVPVVQTPPAPANITPVAEAPIKQITAKEFTEMPDADIAESLAQLNILDQQAQVDVAKLTDELRGRYQATSPLEDAPEFTRAHEILGMLSDELTTSKAGKRVFTPLGNGQGSGYEVTGVPSTFPQWIPEELRSMELFKKVTDSLSPDKIAYPTKGNAVKLRRLYDVLLDAADYRLGIDTGDIRSEIMNHYAKQEQAVATRTTEKIAPSVSGSVAGGKEQSLTEEALKYPTADAFESAIFGGEIPNKKLTEFGFNVQGGTKFMPGRIDFPDYIEQGTDALRNFWNKAQESEMLTSPVVGDTVTVKKLTGGGSSEKYVVEKFYNDSIGKPDVAVLKSVTTGKTKNVSVGSLKKAQEVKTSGRDDASLAKKGGRDTIRKMLERRPDITEPEVMPKDFKISERAKQILAEFGVPIAERGIPPHRYLGLYKRSTTKAIRVQALYDVVTVVHEATHAIDDRIGFSEKLIKETERGAQVRKELTDIYESLYPGGKREHQLGKRIREGLATLIENYFYNPSVVARDFPNLVNAFIKPTGEYYDPLFTKLLERANELVEDYSKLSPEDRIASRIRTGREIVDQPSGFSFKQRAVFETFNRFEPFKRYAKQVGVEGTWEDPTIQAFNIMNKNTIVYNWVKGHETPILLRNGNFRIEKGSVADYLALTKGKEKEWRAYLVARRVFEASNNVNTLKNARDEAIANVVPNQDLVEILMTDRTVVDGDNKTEQPGMSLEQATAKAITRQKEAVAKQFNDKIERIQSVIEADDFSTQDAAAVVEKYAQEFAKPEKIYDDINNRLLDFAESTGLKDAETIAEWKAERGYASFRRYIDDELDSLGTIKTSSKSKVSSFKERTGSQLDIVDPVYSQILAINEIIGKGMENVLWSKVANLTKRSPEIARRFEPMEAQSAVDANGKISFPQEKDPGIIRIFVNGKRQFYKAGPEFIAVVKTLRGKEFDAFVQLLRIPSSLFTRLTTSANPLFAAGNLTVDQFSAVTQTKTGFIPVIDPAKSLLAYMQGDVGLKAYLAVGGTRQTLASYFDLSPDEIVHSLTGGETRLEKITGVLDRGLNILEMPSNISEIMTRFAEYARAVKAGDTMSVAMYKAAQVTTPFQLSGNFGGRLGQEYVKSIPYFNATIQVLYKFGRTAGEDPARVGSIMAALLTAGLTLAIITMKYGSEKQKRLLAEQPARNLGRYLYIPSPNGEDLIRIRIPEQFGVFTGSAYLYTIDAYGKNKATFNDYLDVVSSSIPEQINITDPKKMALSFIPQVLKPSVLVAANTKVFPDVAPIVPQFVSDRASKEQYNVYTAKVSKGIADMLGASPMLTDFWIRNQFGAVGSMLVGKVPGNPLYIQEKDFVMSGRVYNRFYDNRLIVQQQYDDVVKYNPKGYTSQDRAEITLTKKVYSEVSDILSDMRKITQKTELPDELKTDVYELLLKVDSDENISKVMPLIGNVKNKVNALKSKNSIR